MTTPILLHFNGANFSTTFTNANGSGPAFVENASSQAQLDNSVVVFGSNALLSGFNGTNGGIHATSSITAAGQFAIEFRYYPTQIAAGNAICNLGDSNTTSGLILWQGGSGQLELYRGGTMICVSPNGVVSNNVWHAIGVFRDASNICRITVNGAVVATSSATTTSFSGNFTLANRFGSSVYTNGGVTQGRFDELRVMIDESPYASFPYTVATSEWTLPSGTATTAIPAAGVATVSATAKTRARSTATAAAGVATVSATADSVAKTTATPAAGVATVSATSNYSEIVATTAVPAAGMAIVSATTPSDINYAAIAAAVWAFVLPNGKSAGETLMGLWDQPIEGVYTSGDLLRVVAAVAAGKTTITPTAPDQATVEFRAVDDSVTRVTADMDGSERVNVTIDAGP